MTATATPPDFLPAGSYADAGARFLETWLEYDALSRRGRAERGQYYDLYPETLLHQFYAEPLADPNLARVNWNVARPRLELNIFTTQRQKLVLAATPHDCTSHYVHAAWGYQLVRQSTDFQQFLRRQTSALDPQTYVVDLDVGRSGLWLRGRTQWYGGQPTPDELRSHQLQRRLAGHLLLSKIYQLTLCFDCQLNDAVILYGPESYLELRPRHPARDGWEWGRKPPRDDYPGMDILNEPAVAALVDRYGVNANELNSFIIDYLFDRVPPALRQQTLAQYLGEAQMHRVGADLLGLMEQYWDPDQRAAQRIREIEQDAAGLAAFIRQHPDRWAGILAHAFQTDKDAVYAWVEKTHPDVARDAPYEPVYLRTQLELLSAKKKPSQRRIAQLSQRLITRWETSLRHAPAAKLPKEFDATASRIGLSSHHHLVEWAKQYAPEVEMHVLRRAQELTTQAQQRSRKGNAA